MNLVKKALFMAAFMAACGCALMDADLKRRSDGRQEDMDRGTYSVQPPADPVNPAGATP